MNSRVAGYEVTSLQTASACYRVLRPTATAPAGQATLILATRWDRDLLIEAPHVPNDLHTDAEAAALFEALRARALIIAGANRCAVTASSGCHKNIECSLSGVAAQSDPAHSIDNALHAMHLGLTIGFQTITLQLHTNVVPILNGTALVSNGTQYPIPGTAADALYQALRDPAIDVRSCNDPANPAPHGAYCGEVNAQSLASNGAADCCLGLPSSVGDAAAHRFVQLEQNSLPLQAPDAWISRVGAAIAAAIPPVH
jgi:hypothetical protein